MKRNLLLGLACLLCQDMTFAAEPAADATEDVLRFATDVRPLLSDRCFLCHGPDQSTRATDLRLDQADSALDFIEPGDPESSEFIDRILSDDPDYQMPPPDSNLALSDSEKQLLATWISQGAEYEQHWAWVPPERHATPAVGNYEWKESFIDAFVLRRMTEAGLEPSAEADRSTLIRRLTFDLTGLPPTPEEVQRFIEDDSPNAYEDLVDDLLSRPAYGERWASDWLDVARYADTYGYQNDKYRAMWPWRDWVVGSFNSNLPYDQFIVQQVAGDLLPNASPQTILATAFNRNHRQTNEGGSVEEEFRAEYVADRVNTFGAAFLGLTLECARCHDHKYDPISQRDYYSLSAFFNSIDESGLYSHFTDAVPTPTLRLPNANQSEQLDTLKSDVHAAEAELARTREALSGFEQWRSELADVRQTALSQPQPSQPAVRLADILQDRIQTGRVAEYGFDSLDNDTAASAGEDAPAAKLTGGAKQTAGPVGSGLALDGENGLTTKAGGDFRRSDPFTISLWLKPASHHERAVVLHRSRAWTDSGSRGYELLIEDGRLSFALVHFWPGNGLRLRSVSPIPVGNWTQTTICYDGSSRADGVTIYVNGSPIRTEVIRDQLTKTITASVKELAVGNRFRDLGFKGGAIDQLRVYSRQLTRLEARWLYIADARPNNLTEFLYNASDRLLRDFYNNLQPEVDSAKDALRAARIAKCEVEDSVAEIMVMQELPEPRPAYVLMRGAYDAPGEEAPRALPAALSQGWTPNDYANNLSRLDLAKWLVDPANPLVARVAVNRFWQAIFGQGLVATSEDFGMQGQPPTHPELFDTLAIDFVQSGWDVKRLLKQIVMSRTYRQSAAVTPERLAIDPENKWLSRGASFRLPAEMLRDSALAYGILLVRQLGGPPVKPYQPAGLWKEKSGKVYTRDEREGSWRRSLYTYWKRTSPPPSMMTFDASNREVCMVKRQTTMTPLQTLVLLNDPQFVEAARAIATDVFLEHGPKCAQATAAPKQVAVSTTATDPPNSDASAENGGTKDTVADTTEGAVKETARSRELSDDEIARLTEQVFLRMTSRRPSTAEQEVLAKLFTEQLEYFRGSPQAAEELLAIGDYREEQAAASAPERRAQLAALATLAGGLFTFDEVIVKR